MKWTLQNARNHYLKNTPKCINCKFEEDGIKCLVKNEYCTTAEGCEYFTLKDELLNNKGDE